MLDVVRFHESVQEDFPDAHWEEGDMYGVRLIGANGLPVILDYLHNEHTLAVQRPYHTNMLHLEYVSQVAGAADATYRQVDGMPWAEGRSDAIDVQSKRLFSAGEMARYIMRFTTGAVLLNEAGRGEFERARETNRHDIKQLSEAGLDMRSRAGLVVGMITDRYLSWLQQPQSHD